MYKKLKFKHRLEISCLTYQYLSTRHLKKHVFCVYGPLRSVFFYKCTIKLTKKSVVDYTGYKSRFLFDSRRPIQPEMVDSRYEKNEDLLTFVFAQITHVTDWTLMTYTDEWGCVRSKPAYLYYVN